MAIKTFWVGALAKLGEEITLGHLAEVELMEEFALVHLLAQAPRRR